MKHLQRASKLERIRDYIDYRLINLAFLFSNPVVGCNLQVQCKGCTLLTWISPGIGTHSLDELAPSTSCSLCHHVGVKIILTGLSSCRYQIRGKLLAPYEKSVRKEGQTIGGKMTTFDQYENLRWFYLTIRCDP